ncbi:hypothetical protein SDC9_176468 [bioreactor metagenome]|uniref:Uncharacterized protein n=1 Tax=bioreactor metagenome TaxID=1076179 RepID=A0A645GRX4_9ZZZZ
MGDVLAGFAITAGRGLYQHAVFIAQVDRQAVELQLGCVLNCRIALIQTQFAPHPCVKRHRTTGFGISLGAYGQHRYAMTHRGELRQWLATHPQRGRIGLAKFGVVPLERLQFPEQTVIFSVRHRRRIKHVVGMIVPHQLGTQFCRTCGQGSVCCHHAENSRRASGPPAGMR